MSRRATIKRAKIRRDRRWWVRGIFASHGLMRLSASPQAVRVLHDYAEIADIFAPSAEEKAAAEAFFADANKSESAITDDLRAHLIAEDRIRQGDVR